MTVLLALLLQRLRRDRWQLPLWTLGTALLAISAIVGVADTYGTEPDRVSLVATALANPVILLFRGLPSGTGDGAFLVFLILPWLAILAAFMSTFLAVRHTRGDEESGRLELVAATPAARRAPLAATVVHGVIANTALAVVLTIATVATGLPPGGALLVGCSVGGVGLVFLAVGLVSAQLLRTARGANSLAVWTTVVLFVVCGIGNALGRPSDDLTRMESSWLTWVSPFGWAENTRAFDEDAWWPLALCVGTALVLTVVAWALAASRDLGESLVPARRGRAQASAALSTPTALVWRLTRGAVAGWAVGGLLTGALATSLASVVDRLGDENPAVADALGRIAGGGDLAEATVTVFFTMLGVLAACCAVQVVCRARQEEAEGTAEAVLAAPVGRLRWLADHLVVGAVAIVLIVLAGVAGAALGLLRAEGDSATVLRAVWVAAGGQAVAASVFLVVTALVFVLAPRLTIGLGWSIVLVATVVGLFGSLLGMPDRLAHLSPIAAAPHVTGDAVDVAGLWWLCAVVVLGGGAALALMRRRELAPAG